MVAGSGVVEGGGDAAVVDGEGAGYAGVAAGSWVDGSALASI